MIRSFLPRTITRVLLSNRRGHELMIAVVTTSDRFAAILQAVAQVAPKGYSYAETIG